MSKYITQLACVLVLAFSAHAHAQTSSIDSYRSYVQGIEQIDWYSTNQSELISEWRVTCASPVSHPTIFVFDITWQRAEDEEILFNSTGSTYVPNGSTLLVEPTSTFYSEDPWWGFEYFSFLEVLPTHELDFSGYFWPDFY